VKKNLSIIGMAGVGKSFTAEHLAAVLKFKHFEVDKIITDEATKIGANKYLLSDSEFLKLEKKAILSLKDEMGAVIDTGGSVVYVPEAMKVLDEISFIVYLFDYPENIRKRFDNRGEPHLVGMKAGMSFEDLLEDRRNLYEKYAHIKINVFDHKEDLLPKILKEYKS